MEQQDFKQLTDPTYWLSYEYKQIHEELVKLNDKMDSILTLLQSKPKKTTISQVDKKVDNLIDILERKRKIEQWRLWKVHLISNNLILKILYYSLSLTNGAMDIHKVIGYFPRPKKGLGFTWA